MSNTTTEAGIAQNQLLAAVKKTLERIITIAELGEIQRLKNEAIRYQKFEDAVKYRDAEMVKLQELPSLEELKELRAVLNGG